MHYFDTENTKKAYKEMADSGLFDESELDTIKTWMLEVPTLPEPLIGMSPDKSCKVLNLQPSTETIRKKVRDGEFAGGRCNAGWVLSYKEIIRIKKEKQGK